MRTATFSHAHTPHRTTLRTTLRHKTQALKELKEAEAIRLANEKSLLSKEAQAAERARKAAEANAEMDRLSRQKKSAENVGCGSLGFIGVAHSVTPINPRDP